MSDQTTPTAPSTPPLPAAAPRPTNTLAIIAFVISFFVSIAGIICGHLALKQIRETGEPGREFAIAGLVIGYVMTGIFVLVMIVWAVMMVFYLIFFGVMITSLDDLPR
jgi:hypothetical protein